MVVDTHAHIWWPSFAKATVGKDSIDAVIQRAKDAGVEAIIVPGTDILSSQQAIELARTYRRYVYAAVGIHPEDTVHKTLAVTKNATMFNSQMKKLREIISDNRQYVVAVGEIGTDANTIELWGTMTEQMNLMREQCEIALEFELPIIAHSRNSFAETMQVLDSLSIMPHGQLHCFSYDEKVIEETLKRGLYISFCGNITWSKRVQRASLAVPSDRLLLETDSPFMMPRDTAGSPLESHLRNEPKNVTMLAAFQAELRGIPPETLARQTTDNVKRLFGI